MLEALDYSGPGGSVVRVSTQSKQCPWFEPRTKLLFYVISFGP